LVSVEDERCAEELRACLRVLGSTVEPRLLIGEQGLIEVATHEEASCVVAATVGAVGLVPTLRALEAGKRVALANKETLVMAGELVTRTARRSGAELLPIDSEHNALHQCLRGEDRAEVRRLILTASGGPFRACDREAMERATVEEAMRHPTWNMGTKVTIDSATLMNKGLEVIEAHWLFGFDADQIDVLIHPESVVHSMIELIDGSVIAQMGITDMRHAIQYALTYPQRLACTLPRLDLTRIGMLRFERPDVERFPSLTLAYRALRTGGTMPAVMNAANEEAVNAFLQGRLKLTEIARIVARVMERHAARAASSLDEILAADAWARRRATEEIGALGCNASAPV